MRPWSQVALAALWRALTARIRYWRSNASLKEALTSEPDRFVVLGGIPPRPGKRKESRVIRNDYGSLYHADALDIDDDLDEDESGVDVDSDDELESPRPKTRAIELMPDQPALVVRTILYDIRQLVPFPVREFRAHDAAHAARVRR